jgi:hypothetical protein
MSHPIRTLFLSALYACAAAYHPLQAAESDDAFEFLVMGCMPYYMPADAQRFENVIATANQLSPTFSVHCGDTKFGGAPCDDDVYPIILDRFERFTHPLVYVPGDNEWTDCHTPKAGGFDPVDRLDLVRRMFFPQGRSLGNPSIALTSQSTVDSELETFVENNRWIHHGIHFSTLHVVGSNNNARESDEAAMKEFTARDAATIAWLNDSFKLAASPDCRALALFIHGNPFAENSRKNEPRGTGFANFVPALAKAVQAFPKHVYLFHADSHYFRIDKPLTSSTGRTLENFTRIETFGGRNLHLIRVVADPGAPEPLVAFPHLVEANRVDPSTPIPRKK